MHIDDFKKLVADYMNRDQTLFNSNELVQVDKLLLAANNAKAFAQRRMIFELAKARVNVTISQTSGGDLTTATDVVTGLPVRVQSIERAFLPTTDGSLVFPVDIINRDSQVRSLKRRTETYLEKDITRKNFVQGQSFSQIVRHGNKLTLYPWDVNLYPNSPIAAQFDVVQWMPTYGVLLTGANDPSATGALLKDLTQTFITKGVRVGSPVINTATGQVTTVVSVDSEIQLTLANTYVNAGAGYQIGYGTATGVYEDFFLVECVDWMMYRCIQELNMFLKEDQRVIISNQMMKEAWDTVVSWNTRLSQSSDDMDLE